MKGYRDVMAEVGISRGDVMCFRYRDSGKTLFQRLELSGDINEIRDCVLQISEEKWTRECSSKLKSCLGSSQDISRPY